MSRGADIAYLLKQLSAAFRRRLDERLRRQELGLSMAHLAALGALRDEPGLAGAQVARRTMVSAQAMTGILRKLEREALIDRRQQPENRRSDSWRLTPSGRRRLARARRAAEPVMRKMFAGLSDAEHREFKRLLMRCVAALETNPSRPHGRKGLRHLT